MGVGGGISSHGINRAGFDVREGMAVGWGKHLTEKGGHSSRGFGFILFRFSAPTAPTVLEGGSGSWQRMRESMGRSERQWVSLGGGWGLGDAYSSYFEGRWGGLGSPGYDLALPGGGRGPHGRGAEGGGVPGGRKEGVGGGRAKPIMEHLT